jgi:hypothetical protein
MASLLNSSSTLQCPHGGTVSVVSSNTRVKGGKDFLVLATDTFVIAGCPLILGLVPHPCVSVNWVQGSAASTVAGSSTLTEESVGMCVAADQAVQGTVQVVNTQNRVSGK